MSEQISVRDEGKIRTITLNRPQVKNALTTKMAWDIVTAVKEAVVDDDIWVVAITGQDDAFCAGLDLRDRGPDINPLSDQQALMDDIGWIGFFLLALRESCDKPVVAGINGTAAGAGLALAMAADMRLMAESAILIAGYPRIGVSPDGGLTVTLPQAMGYEQTMRFLLENRSVDAKEALRLGLVGEVVSDDQFQDRFAEYCAFLASRPPLAARWTKRAVVRATSDDLTGQVRYELANIRRAFETEDSKEAISAFLEKRTPTFQGR